MDPDKTQYVTNPTRATLFLRTFVPYQLCRFASINLKMIEIIHRSHKTDPTRNARSRTRRPAPRLSAR
jgi:hypothetical protein